MAWCINIIILKCNITKNIPLIIILIVNDWWGDNGSDEKMKVIKGCMKGKIVNQFHNEYGD